MSDEEIALKTLKEVASDDFDTLGDDISPKMAKNILNLIEKQQKEIEELNTELEIRIAWQQYFEKEYINKDKIREKIKEHRKETMLCQEFKDYENANINQQILLAFDKLLEENNAK